MAKKNNTPLGIFAESAGLYFSNFNKFIKYMTFPVLGQFLGLVIIFGTAYFYTSNIPKLIARYPNLNDFGILASISILITLPGLAILCKAFWEYLVAYGAINSMTENLLRSGKVYDFDAHTELIKRRTFSFVGLWLLIGIFSIIALCPLMWVICGILAVYFVLVFQVFTFEPELSPAGCVKKSLQLTKGHFGSTFVLLTLVALVTYLFIPQIVIKAFDAAGINQMLSNIILPVTSMLPLPDFSTYGLSEIKITPEYIALACTQAIFAQILIQYTLPLRSILWSLWYKELNNGILKQPIPVSKKRKNSKRPSEKLMESSRKKYGKQKLDENILKRASEKDED